jgi:hypothetical protein
LVSGFGDFFWWGMAKGRAAECVGCALLKGRKVGGWIRLG